jgi:hypothetical protein
VIFNFPSLQVETDSLTAESPNEPIASIIQNTFEELMCSKNSAVRFCNGDLEVTCKLVVLDLLRSSITLWEQFLSGFDYREDVSTSQGGHQLQEFEKDVTTHESNFSAIRDFGSCLLFLIKSIEPRLGFRRKNEYTETEKEKEMDWNGLVLEVETLHQALQDTATDLLGRSNRDLSFLLTNANNRQAKSAHNLTVVASIFLPLTLAATLLTMNVHVASIGDLWYDWVGLCLTIGFIVVTGVYLWQQATKSSTQRPWKYILLAIDVVWRNRWPALIWGFLQCTTVVASFVAGMFGTKQIAVSIITYGVSGLFAFAVIWLVVKFAKINGPEFRVNLGCTISELLGLPLSWDNH